MKKNTHYLKNHLYQSSCFEFPATTDEYGKKRKFQLAWLNFFSGLVCSKCTNGRFCKYYVLFGWLESGQLGILVSRPLTNFRKATEILREHYYGKQSNGIRNGKLSHINAVADSIHFIKFKVQSVDSLLV